MIFPMDDITDFLYLIGSVFAPMIAIQIADFFILKKIECDLDGETTNAIEKIGTFNWRNLIIWVFGFVLYRCLMQVDLPFGNTIPTMFAVVIICCIVEFIAKRIFKKSR